MSRVLLVDDSPHAQRIGERILTDEDFEVVTVSNGDSALIRLEDVEPDVMIAKAVMTGRSGYEICGFVKMSPRHRHVRVILTAGAMETLDEAEVRRVGADATLRKPFEATALLDAVRPLAEAAAKDRASAGLAGSGPAATARPAEDRFAAPIVAVIDPEQVRAAVTVALDAAMPAMVDEIAGRVLAALTAKRPYPEKTEPRPPKPGPSIPPLAAPLPAMPAAAEPVRAVRVATPFATPVRSPVRIRTGSILGLNVSSPELPEVKRNEPEPSTGS
jgi:CheY-like chemotaxis protein